MGPEKQQNVLSISILNWWKIFARDIVIVTPDEIARSIQYKDDCAFGHTKLPRLPAKTGIAHIARKPISDRNSVKSDCFQQLIHDCSQPQVT
jgi:hypothetical protein